MAAVTVLSDLEPKKIKSVIVSIVSAPIFHEVMGPDAMISFLMLSYKPAFSLSSFTFIKRHLKTNKQKNQTNKKRGYLVPLHFLPLG